MKIVVIGAAPTGLGVAYRLNELKKSNPKETQDVDLLILEQESCPGGLSGTVIDEKGFLWDHGGHITFNHNFPYYEEATKWAVDEWNELQRNCLVDMNYLYDKKGIHLVPYPAQFAVPLFPEKIKQQCLADLKERYENTSDARPGNFEDWILQHFGPTILDVFFKPYTKKVWTVDPLKMSPNWVGTRVAKLPQEKLESLCAMNPEELAKADFGWGPNAVFTFPKHGGTGNVWKSMAGKLPKEWIRYNSRVTNIDVANKQVVYRNVETKEEFKVSYDALVNASPIDLFVRQTKICPELNLIHNKASEEEIRDRAVEGLIVKSIIKREQIVSIYSTTLPYGYPIPSVQRDAELARAHRVLERNGIYSRGRFGGWKYEVSNQDHCFIQGKEVADRLVLGISEKLYKTGLGEPRG